MFGKKKPQAAPAEGGAEARAKARRKKATRLPKGVKQLIGYDAMLRNGIASLGDGRWSATILFQDINYQLSPESHQMEIIDRWAKLINSFEAGQSVQIASYTRSRGVREILADVMMDETVTASTTTGSTTTVSPKANSNPSAATPAPSRP